MARCPTPTRARWRAGCPASQSTLVPSCRLESSPTRTPAMSPRRTAPYHTLARGPRVTSPSTTAPGAMNAVGSMFVLLPHGLERPLHPRVHRFAVLLGGVPAQDLGHVDGLVVEGLNVGLGEDPRLERAPRRRHFDEQDRLPREDRRVGGHGDEGCGQRGGRSIEADVVLVLGGPGLVAGATAPNLVRLHLHPGGAPGAPGDD